MAKAYKGSLTLEWYNKQKSILLRSEEDIIMGSDVPAPKVNWINKEEALFYEINDEEGKGLTPYWVDRNDIRVKEARPMILQKTYRAIVEEDEENNKQEWLLEESSEEDSSIENILIKGDNLLALNTLKKMFDNKPEEDKIKCIYIDPPYNINVSNENYDDNLAHSEWLTLIRDRLILLRDLLSKSGVILVQISDSEEAYLRILLDEIFGRDNFINRITIRTKSPSGFQSVNLGVFETAEYIFLYGKDKSEFNYIPQFTETEYDSNYKFFIKNREEDYKNWKICYLRDFIANEEGYESYDDMKKELSKKYIEDLLSIYSLKYCKNVFRLTAISDSGAGKETVEIKYISKESPDTVFIQRREKYDDRYILNGEEMAFYSKKIRNIDGKNVPTIALTNIWSDIAYEGIASEGKVKFPKSKKPEKLIKRIIEMTTQKNDIVLDSFLGSGTTCAVAHKLERNWIGIEIGSQADELVIPRLSSVLLGSDKTGVTKLSNWQGGGSFKYYHLGESIISLYEDGTGDFNWKLGRDYIEEAFLTSYDYVLDKNLDLTDSYIFPGSVPIIGVQEVGTKKRVAVVSLNAPDENNEFMTYDEIFYIYQEVKKQYNPQYINVFTNRGVEIAYESKPEDLDVIKVPKAIFAELEK